MRSTNFVVGDIFELRNSQLNWPNKINNSENWMIAPDALLEMLFMERYQVGQKKDLRHSFFNMNMAFTSERFEGEVSFGGQHFHGSPLYNALVRLRELDPSPDNAAIIDQLRIWAYDKIQITKTVKEQLDL